MGEAHWPEEYTQRAIFTLNTNNLIFSNTLSQNESMVSHAFEKGTGGRACSVFDKKQIIETVKIAENKPNSSPMFDVGQIDFNIFVCLYPGGHWMIKLSF